MVPGHVPIRRSDIGWLPADGASGQGDWVDTIPYDALPRVYNPPSGYIVTANNRIVPPDYPYFLTRDWAPPYRAERIEQLIAARAQHDIESMAAMQRDQKSLGAARIVPLLVRMAKVGDGGAQAVLERLKAFDGEMAAGKPEPLIYVAWLRELMRALFADELKDAFKEYWTIRLASIEAALTTHQTLCDDKTTDATEDCGAVVGLALERALADLRQRFGDDVEAWRWGDAHAVHGRHRVLGEVPLLGRMFEVHLSNGGEKDTINAGGVTLSDPKNPFAQIHGPGYRAIYDLADPDRSVFIQSTGQSGNPMSPYYKNFAELWRDGGYVPMITTRERIEADKLGTLVLAPR
jgi:penicillin amidase